MTTCWCGNTEFREFSPEYAECKDCGTLVSLAGMSPKELAVTNDDQDFYGKAYWLKHQSDNFDYPDIYQRSRTDLTERNLHWLRGLMKYRLPGSTVMELGCSHGSFVALMREAGYDASGVEMSPWVVQYGSNRFHIPISVGPIENLAVSKGSLDAIVLMDVLEHLPDPRATMAHCLTLLKPDGVLLIQTPRYEEGMNFETLMSTTGPFLEQLKASEHLFLFTPDSAQRLFAELGVQHIKFEPAIFGHYDMFFVASRVPLAHYDIEQSEDALGAVPGGRVVQALLDISSREREDVARLEADKKFLIEKIQSLEADRASRIRANVDASRVLTDEVAMVASRLLETEHTYEDLAHHWWVRLGRKLGFFRSPKA